MANDIITHLDDEATEGIDLNQALEKMRGPVNSKIRLRIVRNGQVQPIELTIDRDVIRLQPQRIGVDLQVVVKDGKLQIEASGSLPLLDFEKGAPTTVVPMSDDEFFVENRRESVGLCPLRFPP